MGKASCFTDWPQPVIDDAGSLFLGKYLGGGATRKVWSYGMDENLVIKIEQGRERWFQNVAEWQIWEDVKDTKWEKYFAPCENISASGLILVQQYADDISYREKPKNLPSFFNDLHIGNFGYFEGRIVCRDYGCNSIIEHGFKSAKLVKANWYVNH